MKENFLTHISQCEGELKKLYPIYKKSIEEVYQLKAESKQFMKELSDLDGGLNPKIIKQQEELLSQLLSLIETFNASIDDKLETFNHIIQEMEEKFNQTLDLFRHQKGEISALLRLRKKFMFLSLLLNKYRTGVHNLQLTNNALFSFSESFKIVKEQYRSNLVYANSVVLESEESVAKMINQIEQLSADLKLS